MTTAGSSPGEHEQRQRRTTARRPDLLGENVLTTDPDNIRSLRPIGFQGLSMNKLDMIRSAYARDDIPEFRPGDTVKVHVRVVEGNRERTQVFEGVVIARNGSGLDATFTVRKLSFGVGVERVFPVQRADHPEGGSHPPRRRPSFQALLPPGSGR